jgi:tetratricopeptide (TPR) repeat protein
VAEEAEGQEHSAVASGAGVDPVAMSLALGAAAQNQHIAAKAEAFLEQQKRVAVEQELLVRLQAKELAHEFNLRRWSLRVHHVSDVMKLAFEVAIATIVIAVVIFIGSAVWNAAHDRGLVVESFQVPPDLAARGLSGQVIANEVLDKLEAMQDATDSDRPAQSYANDWANNFKVQIPDTGVSIGEFYRYLREWLGQETHISGEVFRTANGIAVVARVSETGTARYSGAENDLDALLQKTAETIYARTQPYRYAVYLGRYGHWREAKRIHAADTSNPDPIERAWAWVGLGFIALDREKDIEGAIADFSRSVQEVPDFGVGWTDLANYEGLLGHDEVAIAALRMAKQHVAAYVRSDAIPRTMLRLEADNAERLGDYAAVVQAAQRALQEYAVARGAPDRLEILKSRIRIARAFLHERTANPQSDKPASIAMGYSLFNPAFAVTMGMQDWSAVQTLEPELETAYRKEAPGLDLDVMFTRYFRPRAALATAKLGDGAGALRQIANAPLDCYTCTRIRGDIDAALNRPDAAASWFEMAVGEAPSLPFAYSDWGAMLLAKGNDDAAIEKFREATRKSPHFADPLEMWGEALMLKNRSDLALAKFEEANRYAPNWGRLHLKWGESLLWSGKPEEAKKQFVVAASLDLTPSEKVELARVTSHV